MNIAWQCRRTRVLRAARELLVFAALPIALHLLTVPPDEPVFCGDSNRHVMTAVFFRDLFADRAFADPRAYAEHYFEQYPALGLMVWPPLFHAACGGLMLIFGTSVSVARVLVLVCFGSACFSVLRLTRRVFDAERALGVTILFSVLPLIFDFSRDVMLEVPALALVLLSADLFDLWMRTSQPRFVYGAAVVAAMAALTRFDAVVLLPFYGLLTAFRGRWRLWQSRHVLAAGLIALCLTAPVYASILREAGGLHLRQAVSSVGGSDDGIANGFLASRNWLYYPAAVVQQCGWPVAVLCGVGLLASLRNGVRQRRDVLFALLVSTYITFTPLAELRPRHAIYWLPAVAGFAVCGLEALERFVRAVLPGSLPAMRNNGRLLHGIACGVVFGTTAAASLMLGTHRVVGYREAAALVLAGTQPGDRVFFDGWWDGNFTYFMRTLDSSRSRTVIRGDRLLYDFVCIPQTDFRKWVHNDYQLMEKLKEADPKYIVLECPQFYQTIEVAEQLRNLVREEPRIFRPAGSIAVQSSQTWLPDFRLDVFLFDGVSAANWLQSAGAEKFLPDDLQNAISGSDEQSQPAETPER